MLWMNPMSEGEAMEWKTIESAPNDRTLMLLWVKTRWGKMADALPLTGWGEHGYWYCVNADEAVHQVKPTHWMPLPPPPKGTP